MGDVDGNTAAMDAGMDVDNTSSGYESGDIASTHGTSQPSDGSDTQSIHSSTSRSHSDYGSQMTSPASSRRSSITSDSSGVSTQSMRSLSSAASGSSSGYPDSDLSSRRSSLSSVTSTDSVSTVRSNATVTSSARAERLQLFVNGLDGKTTTVDALDTDTVERLKEKVYEKTKTHPSQQSLSCQGKPLSRDSSTLKEYKVSNRCTVNMSSRLRGGMHITGLG